MDITRFKNDCEEVRKLADMGKKLIEALKQFITDNFGGHFQVKESDPKNSHLLNVYFYGWHLRVRTQITLEEKDVTAQMVAYHIAYGEQQEQNLWAITFDKLGNIKDGEDNQYTPADFSWDFIDHCLPENVPLYLRPC